MSLFDRAGETFKSKDALLARIKSILYGTTPGSAVTPAEAAFLTDCLNHANVYYEYPAEQPVAWLVRMQLMIGRYPEFVFCRADGTQENPSIKRLSMQKPKGGKTAKMAARQSVNDQIKTYRSQCAGCEECGLAGHEVHHAVVSFNEIWQRFVSQPGVSESEIGVVEYRDRAGVMQTYELAQPYHSRFAAFHATHAKLKLLCRECHAKITYAPRVQP